jgi:hypothetical protein
MSDIRVSCEFPRSSPPVPVVCSEPIAKGDEELMPTIFEVDQAIQEVTQQITKLESEITQFETLPNSSRPDSTQPIFSNLPSLEVRKEPVIFKALPSTTGDVLKSKQEKRDAAKKKLVDYFESERNKKIEEYNAELDKRRLKYFASELRKHVHRDIHERDRLPDLFQEFIDKYYINLT